MEKTEKNNKVIQVRFEGEKEARKRAIERRKEIKRKKEMKQIKILGVASVLSIGAILGLGSHMDKKVNEAAKQLVMESENYNREREEAQRNEKEEWLNGIKVNAATRNEAEAENTDVIEKIIERYNEKLPEGMEEISKEDIGIIKENLGEGNIYRETDEEGQTKYIQNYTGSTEQDNSELDWVEAKDIGEVIAILDKENHTTIAGMGIIDGDYVPVEIQQMILQSEYENPYTESDYYVKLKGSQENYQALEKAYQKRVQELSTKTEQDTEMELS